MLMVSKELNDYPCSASFWSKNASNLVDVIFCLLHNLEDAMVYCCYSKMLIKLMTKNGPCVTELRTTYVENWMWIGSVK